MTGRNNAQSLVLALKDEYTTIVEEGKGSAEFTSYIDTGSLALNALISGSIYGGHPDNKVVFYGGLSSTGKTFFALNEVYAFLNLHPDGVVVYYDTEAAVTKKMFKNRGIDTTRVIISEPKSLEAYNTSHSKLLARYAEIPKKDRYPLMVVLDSLSQIPSEKELADVSAGTGTRDMTKAQQIAAFFRVLRLEMARLGIPMVITGHVYMDFMANAKFSPMRLKGGEAAIYASDVIIMLGKAKEREGSGATSDIVGAKITCTTHKSRFGREGRKVKVLLWHDERGCDRYTGMPELAVEAGIWKKVGNKIEVDGKLYYEKVILKDPDKFFTKDILDTIDAYARTQFEYGSGNQDTVSSDE